MPIPLLHTPRETPANSFQLVPYRGFSQPAALLPRALAYGLDLLVVAGTSLYSAKLLSLFLVSYHLPAIKDSGRLANRLFLDLFSQGQFLLGTAIFVLVYAAYFVGFASKTGKTLGLGLFGLKLEGHFGQEPGPKGLSLRQLGCLLQFCTAGLMHLQLLEGPRRPMIQDALSGTRVVSDR